MRDGHPSNHRGAPTSARNPTWHIVAESYWFKPACAQTRFSYSSVRSFSTNFPFSPSVLQGFDFGNYSSLAKTFLKLWDLMFSPCAAALTVTAKVLSHFVLSAPQLWLQALEPPVSDNEMHRGRRKRAQLHLPCHRSAVRQGTTSKHSCRSVSLEMGQNLCILTTFYTRAH